MTGNNDPYSAGGYQPSAEGKKYFLVKNAAQLANALAAENAVIQLTSDVTLDTTTEVRGNITLNLGAHTITGANVKLGGIQVNAGAKLVINATSGGIRGGSGADCQALTVLGSVDIRGGNFSVGPDANGLGNSCVEVRNNASYVNIYGGTFASDAAYNNRYFVLNVQQTAGVTTPVVKVFGGTFVNYNPSTGDDALGGNFVAEGKTVIETVVNGQTVYTVA